MVTIVTAEELFEATTPAQRAWILKRCGEAEHAVVAWGGKRPEAFLRYTFLRGTFWAAGTWVTPRARGAGLACGLWTTALALHVPRRVRVAVASDGGAALVDSLHRRWPVEWIVTDLRR